MFNVYFMVLKHDIFSLFAIYLLYILQQLEKLEYEGLIYTHVQRGCKK